MTLAGDRADRRNGATVSITDKAASAEGKNPSRLDFNKR